VKHPHVCNCKRHVCVYVSVCAPAFVCVCTKHPVFCDWMQLRAFMSVTVQSIQHGSQHAKASFPRVVLKTNRRPPRKQSPCLPAIAPLYLILPNVLISQIRHFLAVLSPYANSQFGAGKNMFSLVREWQKLALVNAYAGIISGTATLHFAAVLVLCKG
jgi:hypothetical protein